LHDSNHDEFNPIHQPTQHSAGVLSDSLASTLFLEQQPFLLLNHWKRCRKHKCWHDPDAASNFYDSVISLLGTYPVGTKCGILEFLGTLVNHKCGITHYFCFSSHLKSASKLNTGQIKFRPSSVKDISRSLRKDPRLVQRNLGTPWYANRQHALDLVLEQHLLQDGWPKRAISEFYYLTSK